MYYTLPLLAVLYAWFLGMNNTTLEHQCVCVCVCVRVSAFVCVSGQAHVYLCVETLSVSMNIKKNKLA